MIIDNVRNIDRYIALHPSFEKAFSFLKQHNPGEISLGKHVIDDENIFAIVQEYETLDAVKEQMESHKKYIDVQYMVSGAELVRLSTLSDQQTSKEYDQETDFMLYADPPSFFADFSTEMFM